MNEDELALKAAVDEYEDEYFEDMRFEDGSITDPFMGERDSSDRRYPQVYHLPADLYNRVGIRNSGYRFTVVSPDDSTPTVLFKPKTVSFGRKYIKDKAAILHEMIHVHEETLSDRRFTLHKDALFLCLYNKLKAKVDQLDDRIFKQLQFHDGAERALRCGPHGILFYLKALELDLRCGWEPETVLGFEKIKQKPGVSIKVAPAEKGRGCRSRPRRQKE